MTAARDIATLWLDNRKVGCGYRRAVVLATGRKWVRLMTVGGLARFKLSVDDYRAGLVKVDPMTATTRRVMRRQKRKEPTHDETRRDPLSESCARAGRKAGGAQRADEAEAPVASGAQDC